MQLRAHGDALLLWIRLYPSDHNQSNQELRFQHRALERVEIIFNM